MDQVYSQTSIVEYKTKADEAQAVQKSVQKHNFTLQSYQTQTAKQYIYCKTYNAQGTAANSVLVLLNRLVQRLTQSGFALNVLQVTMQLKLTQMLKVT